MMLQEVLPTYKYELCFQTINLLFVLDICKVYLDLHGVAQRFALLAGGWAWTMLIIVVNAEARKMLENATNPTSQVHAVLGVFIV